MRGVSLIRHDEHWEASPHRSLGWQITPGLLLALSIFLLVMMLLPSVRFSDDVGAIAPITVVSSSSTEERIKSISSDFDSYLNAIEHALNLANIPKSERRSNYRGIPDRGDLPPLMLFIALGLSILWVPRKLEYLEDDSPGVRLRVCRARPPTFRDL
jgi:hypothetical protein